MNQKPNIVLILLDDMGFSDLGCYGGEIDTPNIDKLAGKGIKFTQFYNTARCCPTRASLLTGLHPHQTGIGHMTNPPGNTNHDLGTPGYRGFLNRQCVTAGEVLKDIGYHTFISGKWHLGMHELDRWPLQRGFERFYGILAGGCNYFEPSGGRGLTYGNESVEADTDEYYTTDAFTDYAIKFVEEIDDGAPFFLYLAYNAPHWPLQAKKEDVEKYKDKYLCGWDEIRKQRYERMRGLGIIDETCALSQRDGEVRAWEELDSDKKEEMAERMAIYAAQIDCVDQNIGRLIKFLEENEQADNTLILFMSDNGACAEGGEFGAGDKKYNNAVDMPSIFQSVGQAWANASNTPFRKFKHYVHEGGIATPLIAYWPDKIRSQAGTTNHFPAYLIDIMPTLLEIANAEYPKAYHGNDIHALEGLSMVPLLYTGTWQGHEAMFWEHESNCTCRMGDYKAIQKYDTGEWELYDLSRDRSETRDLACEKESTLKDITDKWYKWAKSHSVIPKPEDWKF